MGRAVAARGGDSLVILRLGGSGASDTLVSYQLTVHGLFEQVGQEKRVLEILSDGDAAMAAEDHDRAELQLLDDFRRIGDRRRLVAHDRDLADRIFLLERQRREALVRKGKSQ